MCFWSTFRSLSVALISGLVLVQGPDAVGQSAWPNRPVRIVVVYPPGGLSDATARAIAEKLASRIKVPVVVENRAGGGGVIGMDMVAKSAPDGHVLAYSAISPITLNPHVSTFNVDLAGSIAPVVSVMQTPVIVVGTPGFAGSTFRDLVAMAKASPGRMRWGTSGQATVGHLVLEQVRTGSQIDLLHIPYKGGGQQLHDALSGHFEILSTNVAAAQLEYIRTGKFKALAVGAPGRLAILPEVPTLSELGLPAANLTSHFGIFAPGRTPENIIARINDEVGAVLRSAGFREQIIASGNVPGGGGTGDFARQIAMDSARNLAIVKAAGIKLD